MLVYLFWQQLKYYFLTVLSLTVTKPDKVQVSSCRTDIQNLELQDWFYTSEIGSNIPTQITLSDSSDPSSCLNFLLQLYPSLIVSTNSKLGLCVTIIPPTNAKTLTTVDTTVCDAAQTNPNQLYLFKSVIISQPFAKDWPPLWVSQNVNNGRIGRCNLKQCI
jgi:hypothetical protein